MDKNSKNNLYKRNRHEETNLNTDSSEKIWVLIFIYLL